MKPELIHSQPDEATSQRITRVMTDVLQLKKMSVPQARASYRHLEAARDALSHILDRADGKS